MLTNPNICLAGQIGRGKSALAKSLATRGVAYGRRIYVPGDPKGERRQLAIALGGQANPRSEAERMEQLADMLPRLVRQLAGLARGVIHRFVSSPAASGH